jgi:serine/threonine-protein phosphatase 2B regulatory subunit
MGCVFSSPDTSEERVPPGSATPVRERSVNASYRQLAEQSNFSTSEIESLQELYDKLSNELHHDGLIHKDELAWALFKCHRDNLFVDRVFQLFDIKRNNVIDFEEFVLSLSVFHPNAPLEEKAKFAFHIYDINQSGAIEPPELKRFLVAIMADNPDIHLDDESLDKIVSDTFNQVDMTGDGKINPEEWMALVNKNPSIISYMTLPVLADICRKFPPSPQSAPLRGVRV